MKDLFRGFSREGVEYLLIGGQAAVLYGASGFTQDLDLWVRPAAANVRALLQALARLRGTVYKLTPSPTLRNLKRGHGFHFRVRGTYLDVMGRPPRAPSFSVARARAAPVDTPWGRIPVVAIRDLVDLKKTNRPGDYEVISRLARIRLAGVPRPDAALLQWAAGHMFRAEDLADLVEAYGARLPRADPAVRTLLSRREAGPRELDAVGRILARRSAVLMNRGRIYWLPRLRELRAMRRRGELLPEGLPVRRLLASGLL